MIYAVVSHDLYRYETDALLRAFYPGEEVRVLLVGGAGDNTAGPPFLSVEYSEHDIGILIQDGERSLAEHVGTDAPHNFCVKSTETKDALKHLLYETLCRFTGRTLPWGELIGVRPTKIATTRLNEGYTAEEAAAYLMDRHYVSRGKAVLAADIALREMEILGNADFENGVSLYAGIPYCPSTCMYCSFPSYPLAGAKGQVDRYLDALLKELEEAVQLLQGKRIDTIYFGGGTPTSLEADELNLLLSRTEDLFYSQSVKEWTVEAGRPDSISVDKLKAMKAHPVTRISVNPQTMNDRTLRIIGRAHTAEDTVRAFGLARQEGFDNINMDMILGLPGETIPDVEYTLGRIAELTPDSLTVHSLAVKRGSRLQEYITEKGYDCVTGSTGAMDVALEAASRMGMEPYYLYRQKNMTGDQENIGFARDGKYGLYNILIMEELQSIIAAGAGAVSKMVMYDGDKKKIVRSDNPKDIETYIAKMEAKNGE